MSLMPQAGPVLRLREVMVDDRAGLDRIADLHMELLNFGPMAGLGWRFIRDICYAAHMQDALLRVVLAEIDGEPAGFVAYTPMSIGFHRSGLKKHWLAAGWGVLRAVTTDPRRLVKLARALKILGSRRAEVETASDPLGEVVCVAVRKPYLAPAFVRQSGLRLSQHLIHVAADHLVHLGVDRMRMIVDADNKPVLMLYHLMGAHFEPYAQGGEPRVQVWFDITQSARPARDIPKVWQATQSTEAGDEESWRAYWERIEDGQAVFRIEAGDYARRLRESVGPGAGQRILDFGCGFGHVATRLAPYVGSVALWDASSTVRQRARTRVAHLPNVEFIDLSDLQGIEAAGQFDFILAHSVLQYMSPEEIRSWLKRWAGMLAADGRLVLSDIIRPGSGGLGEILGYLMFAARNGFFADAFVSGLKEIRSYSSARRTRPLTVLDPSQFESWARDAGLEVTWLPRNLSHRQSRRTAVLTALH